MCVHFLGLAVCLFYLYTLSAFRLSHALHVCLGVLVFVWPFLSDVPIGRRPSCLAAHLFDDATLSDEHLIVACT